MRESGLSYAEATFALEKKEKGLYNCQNQTSVCINETSEPKTKAIGH